MGGRFGEAVRPLREAIGRASRFLKPKLPDLADLAMVLVILGAVAMSLVNQSFIFTDKVLTGSIVGFALSYLFASRALRHRKEIGVRRIFIGLCALVSSVWLFEIVWRLWGFDTWHLLRDQLFTLSFANPWPLGWALLMVSLVFAGVRYMGLNRWFLLLLALSLVTFWLWKAVGFPQFPHPEWWPSKVPILPVIPLEYTHAPTPEARATIVFWGEFLNSVAKVFWCALPGALFLTRENIGAPGSRRWWPVWPALKSLFMPWTDWKAPRDQVAVAEAPAPGHSETAAAVVAVPPVELRSSGRDYPNLGDHLKRLMRTRAADFCDLFMVAVMILVLSIAAWNHTFVLTGRVLAASIAVYAFCYVVASRSLRRVEEVGYERIFIASCAMVSGVWLFEAIHHFGWIVSWDLFTRSLTNFEVRPPALREPFPLMWTGIVVAVAFVGCRWMKVNRWFYVALVGGIAVYVLWLAVGYPSFTDPWRSPQPTEIIEIIPPELAHPRTPAHPGWGYIAFLGAVFTAFAKLFICVLPATLYTHHLKREAGAAAQPPDDVLLRAWKGVGKAVAFVRLEGDEDEKAQGAKP